MAEPAYSFSLPSIHDDTPLDCRVYHPKHLLSELSDSPSRTSLKGAVLAHPYAPLGGCFDDPVVLSVTETLLEEGSVVVTFNFRGAGDSAGSTSLTGKGEQDDFVSIIAFFIYYLQDLIPHSDSNELETIPSVDYDARNTVDPPASFHSSQGRNIQLLLAGYSYGSLVLARIPSVPAILERLSSAKAGTAASEIHLRATALATETKRAIPPPQGPSSLRGRQLKPSDAATSPDKRTGVSPVMLGGEETDASVRRRSRESRRSADLVRRSMEKAHIKRQSLPKASPADVKQKIDDVSPASDQLITSISVRYLLISPVLLPFTHALAPPGGPSSVFSLKKRADTSSAASFLEHPTLAVFGSTDGFTSSSRLKAWAEKQSKASRSTFDWAQTDGAGHFWREEGVMQALKQRIRAWAKSNFAKS